MITNRMMRLFSAAAMASVLMISAPAALSHGGSGAGPGYGMGGAGPGTMMGPGGGMMGPGMMGPGVAGSGMMGPGMMGPGAMGPGMPGRGYGMHREWMGHGANLSAEQRATIDGLRSELRHQQWNTLGAMLDARDALYDLLSADAPDPQQVGAAFERLSKLERQMLEAHVATHNRMLAILTDEQRAELGEWQHGAMHRWAYGGGGYGMMPGM